MRICKICKKNKKDTEFYKTYDYIRYICKKCENQRQIKWKRKRVRELKLRAIEYKGGKCIKCGYKKCIFALDFHHKNPKDKEYAICKLMEGSSWERLKKELDKCDLICANCHREIYENN